MNSLLRHDGQIMVNQIRRIFGRWQDGLLISIFFLAVPPMLKVLFADRPWTVMAGIALAGGLGCGIAVGRLVWERLVYHSDHGVLAADALCRPTRMVYGGVWHGIAMTGLAVLTLIVRPSALPIGLLGYAIGGLLVLVIALVWKLGPVVSRMRLGFNLLDACHRPSTGIAAALILLFSLLSVRVQGTDAMMTVAVIQTVLFTLPLTSVNDRVVRFMLIVGHGTLPTIAHHAKGLTGFFALAVTSCWLITTPAVAGAVVAISGAALLLLGLRVLTYRLYNRRLAELVLFVIIGLLTTLAFTVPVAVPFCVVAVLWQLQRKSAAKRWLLG
jgi:hypothetical protein